MNMQMVLDITEKTITVAALAAAPLLITSIVVGVLINIFQTVTQLRDTSISFVPKAAVSAIVLAMTLSWGLNLQIEFCIQIFRMIGEVNK